MLRREGHVVGRKRVRTLMRRMGIEALYRKPNTGRRAPGQQIYPYLLRHLVIDRPIQVWAMDMTYILMARAGLAAGRCRRFPRGRAGRGQTG